MIAQSYLRNPDPSGGFGVSIANSLDSNWTLNSLVVADTSSFQDSKFQVINDPVASKVFKLNVSNVATGTTRTFTVPDSNGILPCLVTTVSTGPNLMLGDTSYAITLPTSTGINNIFLGQDSGKSITQGTNNILIGKNSGRNISSFASNNTLIGVNCLSFPTFAMENVAIGSEILTSAGISGLIEKNVAIGHSALNNSGVGCVAVGFGALLQNSTGVNNIAIGNTTLVTNTIGQSNIAIGAGANTDTANRNGVIIIGSSATSRPLDNSITIGNDNVETAVVSSSSIPTANRTVSIKIGSTVYRFLAATP